MSPRSTRSPAAGWGSATAARAPTGRRPTARQSASFAPCSLAGPTVRSTAQAKNGQRRLTAGSGTTTIDGDTQPSVTNPRSAGPTCSGLTPRTLPILPAPRVRLCLERVLACRSFGQLRRAGRAVQVRPLPDGGGGAIRPATRPRRAREPGLQPATCPTEGAPALAARTALPTAPAWLYRLLATELANSPGTSGRGSCQGVAACIAHILGTSEARMIVRRPTDADAAAVADLVAALEKHFVGKSEMRASDLLDEWRE